MHDWPLVALGDLLTPSIDRHPVEAGKLYPNIGIYGFGRGVFEKPPIDGGSTSASALFRVKAGQLIYSRLFAFEGAYALVPAFADGAYVSNEYPAFEIDAERVVPEFLGWLFRLPGLWESLAALTSGMGDRRRRLHPERFLTHEIPLPPKLKQTAVVAHLEAMALRLAEVGRLRREIQNDAQALLHSVFHRLIQGAEYRPLAEVAPIVRRPVELDLDTTYEEIGIRSFHRGVFFKCLSLGSDISHKSMFRMVPGDLVFSNIMAWEGAVAVVRPEDEGRIGVHRFITCVPKAEIADAHFLWFYFQTGEGFEKIVAASPATIARNRTLSVKKLEAIHVPIPGYEKQQEFSTLQAKVAAIRRAHADNQPELDALLPAVLDKVFKGEL